MYKKVDFDEPADFIFSAKQGGILNEVFSKDKFVKPELVFPFLNEYIFYSKVINRKVFVFYKLSGEGFKKNLISLTDSYEFTKVSYFYFIRIFFFFEFNLLRLFLLWFLLNFSSYLYLRWCLFCLNGNLKFFIYLKNLFINFFLVFLKLLFFIFYSLNMFYLILLYFLNMFYKVDYSTLFERFKINKIFFLVSSCLVFYFYFYYVYFFMFIFIVISVVFIYEFFLFEVWILFYFSYFFIFY